MDFIPFPPRLRLVDPLRLVVLLVYRVVGKRLALDAFCHALAELRRKYNGEYVLIFASSRIGGPTLVSHDFSLKGLQS
jgi:hypothetical protein